MVRDDLEKAPNSACDTKKIVVHLSMEVPEEEPAGGWGCWLRQEILGLRQFPPIPARRVFGSLSRSEGTRQLLEILGLVAERRDEDFKEGRKKESRELLSYLVLDCPCTLDFSRLFNVLSECGNRVTLFYPEAGEAFPSNEGVVNLGFVCGAGHLEEAPDGVDAKYSWRFPGGEGTGVRFMDVESGWEIHHTDLIDVSVRVASGENVARHENHGTMTLGLVAAARNGLKGITGIAPSVASVRVLSIQRTSGEQNVADAVLAAVAELRYGDVLLLELHAVNEADGRPFRPIEVEPAIFDAIRLGTALGITIIEPAGNGGSLLDRVQGSHPDKPLFLDRFRPEHQDSGSVMIAAAQRNSSPQYSRLESSNHGNRIDSFACGDGIRSISDYRTVRLKTVWHHLSALVKSMPEGTVPLKVSRFLRFEITIDELLSGDEEIFPAGFGLFRGTSAASAVIAGVALCVQGLAQANLGFRFSPWQLRRILSDPANGTPSANGKADSIGVMPDLRKIIDHTLNLPPQSYLRDSVGDLGELPRTQRWASPDIIVLPTEIEKPQAELGEGSERENHERLSSMTVPRPEAFIYLRARNRGGEDARGVRARVYWAPPATVLVPRLWTPVEETIFSEIPQGDLLTVAAPIKWHVKEECPDRVAWITLLDDGREDLPSFGALRDDWATFLDAIRKSNFLAFRNLHVVEHVKSAGGDMDDLDHASHLTLPFLVPGMPQSAGDIRKVRDCLRLEVLSRLPRKTRVWLRMEPKIADLRGIWGDPPQDPEKEPTRDVYVPINPNGRHPLRETALAEGDQAMAALVVYIPLALRCNSYQIAVRQLWEDEEVGRITFRLVPRREAEVGEDLGM